MTLPPRVRQIMLTAHVAASVGWLGAVAGSVALAVAGLVSPDARTVRAAYLMLEVTGWFVLLPLSVATLLTGLVQSLGTPWGLFRHYWILAKLGIAVLATVVLLSYMETFGVKSDVAADPGTDLSAVRNPSPVIHAAAALLALLVTTTLSVVKPRGLTPYGQRKRQDRRPVPGRAPTRADT